MDGRLDVWKRYPIFGVGAYNVGVVAARDASYGDYGQFNEGYSTRPRSITGRYTIAMCSFWPRRESSGRRFGSGCFGSSSVSCGRCAPPPVRRLWSEGTGGAFDLQYIAIGLELAMVAFLVNAFFYNRTFMYEYYVLLAVPTVLWKTTRPRPAGRAWVPAASQ